MIDLERGDRHAVLLIDDAVACIFGRRDRHAFHGILLVLVADTNVIGVCALEVLHQRHGLLRPDDAERALPVAVAAADPTREPQVGDAGRMVGVKVGEEHGIQRAHRHAELIEPDGGPATDVEQQPLLSGLDERLLSGLDERRSAEPVGSGEWHARPEQRHLEVLRHCRGLHGEAGGQDRRAPSDAHLPPPCVRWKASLSGNRLRRKVARRERRRCCLRYFATSTGHCASCMMRSARLPIMRSYNAEWPFAPMTSKSTLSSEASPTMSRTGWPATTWV